MQASRSEAIEGLAYSRNDYASCNRCNHCNRRIHRIRRNRRVFLPLQNGRLPYIQARTTGCPPRDRLYALQLFVPKRGSKSALNSSPSPPTPHTQAGTVANLPGPQLPRYVAVTRMLTDPGYNVGQMSVQRWGGWGVARAT
jgi:hypothetical protein